MSLEAGETFAGYTILRKLGSGGMGAVYLAQHPRLPRQDALKVLPANLTGDPEYRARFLREAEIAAGLSHPNIVAIYDRGEYDGRFWISMQYVPGTDMSDLMSEHYPGGMPVDGLLAVIKAVGSALDYAHYRGLLHRDVKPANILLTDPDGPTRRAYLADFGIARHIEDSSKLTATNMAVGTVTYAAPEQLMGEAVDGRADQYALACTMFHLLTGAPPYSGSSPAVITQHMAGPIPSLEQVRPDLGALDAVLRKAMAKDPADRFGTCQEFTQQLEQSLGMPAIAGEATQPAYPRILESDSSALAASVPTTLAPAPKRRIRRSRIVIAVIAAIVVLVGAGVFGTVKLLHRRSLGAAGPESASFAGTYRVDYGPATSLDGQPIEGSPKVIATWGVRSLCLSSGCVATAAIDGGPTVLLSNLVFDQIGESWVAVALSSVQCEDGATETWVVFTLRPQSDGTLSGVTTAVTTNSCSAVRRTVTFTRTGDADNDRVADPDAMAPRATSKATALRGRYRMSRVFANGASAPGFTDLAVQTDCLRTGDRCISVFPATDGVVTLVFGNDRWMEDSEVACSRDGDAVARFTAGYLFPDPPQDPIQLLTGRGRAVSSEGTCEEGNFNARFERIGD
jgi:serine/threonine-protein kinase